MAGRPTEYEDTYPELLLEHMKQGLSFESFGGLVGVSKQTLYTWAKQYPEFLDAKEKGSVASLLEWEKMGKAGLYNETIKDDDGMTITRSINATIYKLNMNCRFRDYGWGEKSSVELSGPEGKPIEYKNHSDMTEEELNTRLAELRSKDGDDKG